MKVSYFCFLIVFALSMSSCATIFTGTRQVVQIESDPPGARIQVDGIDRGVTPAAVKLKKSSGGQVITLRKEGYVTRTFQTQTVFNGVSVLNLMNILFWAIDGGTGAMWKYNPDRYEVFMAEEDN